MPDQIPVEAQELIRQFEEEEARKAAERAVRKGQPAPREIKTAPLRNVTAKEMMARARNVGCEIVPGGKHGTHIKGPDGREISLPVHGGGQGNILATGTTISIDRFLTTYRSTGIAPARAEQNPQFAPASSRIRYK